MCRKHVNAGDCSMENVTAEKVGACLSIAILQELCCRMCGSICTAAKTSIRDVCSGEECPKTCTYKCRDKCTTSFYEAAFRMKNNFIGELRHMRMSSRGYALKLTIVYTKIVTISKKIAIGNFTFHVIDFNKLDHAVLTAKEHKSTVSNCLHDSRNEVQVFRLDKNDGPFIDLRMCTCGKFTFTALAGEPHILMDGSLHEVMDILKSPCDIMRMVDFEEAASIVSNKRICHAIIELTFDALYLLQ